MIGINFEINDGRTTLELNFDVTIGRAALKACSAK
jgi:hypothetical protein